MSELKYCARCKGNLIGSYEELSCLACGWTPAGGTDGIESTASLGAGSVARMRIIADTIAGLEREIEEGRREGARFLSIARLCETDIPDGLVRTFGARKRGPYRARSKSGGRTYACRHCGRGTDSTYGNAKHENKCTERPVEATA